VLREILGAGVRLEPVVKADAYGHGAVPIVRALEAAGADGVSVAALDEAVELRDAGLRVPVLVLYPVPADQIRLAMELDIAVAVGGGEALGRALAIAASAVAADPGTRPLAVHLEVETGLGRGGVPAGEVAGLAATIRRSPGVRLDGIWTHVAAADDLPRTRDQDGRFAGALGGLSEAVDLGTEASRRHFAASGVVLAADVPRYDAVRVGLSVYGLIPDGLELPSSTATAAARLRPVMRLIARPVRVAELPPGHGVSYGPSFVTARPSRIATLPLGYGDGWRRTLSDRSHALVRGVRVPLVGRVSMDAVMADVTDVPGPAVTEADEFVLLGRQGDEVVTAHQLAATCETISYEIVTGMSRRMPRVYHAADSPVEVRFLAGGRTD
jgi:alanine racemase